MERNPYAPPQAPVIQAANPNDQFRDLSRSTTVLSRMLLAGAAVSAISLVSSVMQYELLLRESFSEAEGSANDLREQVVGIVALSLYLTTLFAFGRWIFLAHRNLLELGARNLTMRPGWAVGSFAIPIINLYAPYKAMRELLRASESPTHWHLTDPPWWTWVWWLLWVVSLMLGNYVMRQSVRATSLPELSNLTVVEIVSCVLAIPLYLLGRLIVIRVWNHQAIARGIAYER
jgi:hypothetical protein